MSTKKKITFTINTEVKDLAKTYVKQKGISLSKLVEDYLRELTQRKPRRRL